MIKNEEKGSSRVPVRVDGSSIVLWSGGRNGGGAEGGIVLM